MATYKNYDAMSSFAQRVESRLEFNSLHTPMCDHPNGVLGRIHKAIDNSLNDSILKKEPLRYPHGFARYMQPGVEEEVLSSTDLNNQRIYAALSSYSEDIDLNEYFWVNNKHIMNVCNCEDYNKGVWYGDDAYVHRDVFSNIVFTNSIMAITFNNDYTRCINVRPKHSMFSEIVIVKGLIPILRTIKRVTDLYKDAMDAQQTRKEELDAHFTEHHSNEESTIYETDEYVHNEELSLKWRGRSGRQKKKVLLDEAISEMEGGAELLEYLDVKHDDLLVHVSERIRVLTNGTRVTCTYGDGSIHIGVPDTWYVTIRPGDSVRDEFKYFDVKDKEDIQNMITVLNSIKELTSGLWGAEYLNYVTNDESHDSLE